MAKKTINIGSTPNDGTGTSLRQAGDWLNDNFSELYSLLGDGVNILIDLGISDPGDSSLPNDGDVIAWNAALQKFVNSNGGVGTVTSVGITGSNGIQVSDSPVTGAGNITLGLSNIPNSSLANSTVSYGGVTIALGGSDATPAFDLSDATFVPLIGSVTKDTFTNGQLLIGKADGNLAQATIAAGSSNILITNGDGTITLDLGTTINLTGKTVTYRSIVNADISASAAIVYSKLNLTGSIVNADISASAAIAYSKLNLTGSVADADIASSANIPFKNVVGSYSKQQYFSNFTLTDGASISWNLDNAQVATVTLGGDRILSNPTNMKSGATYILIVKQDGTGSRMLSYGTSYKWPSGVGPVLSTGSNDIDILSFVSDGTNMYGSAQFDYA